MYAALANPWYRPNPAPWRWLAIGAGVFAVGGIVFWATRARAGDRAPWQPPAPGEVPLRPPPPGQAKSPGVPMGPPGPLASMISEWVDAQDDSELQAARAAMPAHWWSMLVTAAQMPEDGQVLIVLNPLIVDLSVMPPDERSALQSTLVDAVGYWDAYKLKGVFDAARAASGVS